MRKTILLAYFALTAAIIMPFIVPENGTGEAEPPALTAEPETVTPTPAAVVYTAPETITVLNSGETREMELQEYLCGVVAAEMPASFELEALKAQAVAARTFAAAGDRHENARVCTDPGCCQAWCSTEAQRQKWGENYDEYTAKIARAVEETKGQVLCYEGEPIFAAFHSSSPGATEDCAQVWNPRPYLVSVSSPETAEDVPNFVSTVQCYAIDFRDTVLSVCPEADFTGEADAWIGACRYDGSGRVAEIELGGRMLKGTEIRSLFSLRSAAFVLEYADGVFCFTVTGYGHGVGMSQYGANVMAREGADYADILAHYYPNTLLTG